MNKLTKKYIFAQKLREKPILLTGRTHREWLEMIKLLCECNVLRRTNKGAIDVGNRTYNILFYLTINNLGDNEMITLGQSHFSQYYQLHINNCRGTPDENGETN